MGEKLSHLSHLSHFERIGRERVGKPPSSPCGFLGPSFVNEPKWDKVGQPYLTFFSPKKSMTDSGKESVSHFAVPLLSLIALALWLRLLYLLDEES